MTESHAKRLQDALEWYFKNQDSDDRATVTATARIFQLNISTLRKAIQRQLTPALPSVRPEGRPAFLKPYQREVLLAHICNQAYDGNPLNRAMLYEGTFQNCKSLTVIECVSADGIVPIPPIILVEGTKFVLDYLDLTQVEQSIIISSWKELTEAKARSRKRITKSKDGGHVFDLQEKIIQKKQAEEATLQKQAKTMQRKQDAQIKKIYLEDLKEWKAKERERKASIRRITGGKKKNEHLVPTHLWHETPNKPIDLSVLKKAMELLNDDEQEVDIVLKRAHEDSIGQLSAPEQSISSDSIPVTIANSIRPIQGIKTTKATWLDQDFVGFDK
ncbi:hypothetical protein B7463_g9988, partial [Scytalidium lignicola]